MALKYQLDTLDGLSSTDAKHYTKADDGKFRLVIDGEPTESSKLAEFRDKNIALIKDLSKFDGIDPEAVKVERAELAALKAAKPNERITELEGQLAAEKAARADAEQKAATNRVRDTFQTKASAIGARLNALDIISGKAEALFTVVNGVVQAKPNTFSKTRPGELLTPDEWLGDATREFPFLFEPSSGSGAHPLSSSGGTVGNIPELRDPTPEQLGRHADDILAGKLKVVTSS
jgi:hypothetical protein